MGQPKPAGKLTMPMSWFQQRRYDYRKQISTSVTFNEVHVKQPPRLIEVARCCYCLKHSPAATPHCTHCRRGKGIGWAQRDFIHMPLPTIILDGPIAQRVEQANQTIANYWAQQ